ncbi:MAG: TIGR00282 family metallophosphoesterase [Candidatus Spechtbacterales bacterium]|nr:TIGR00282 family metallophosphoesterase [Candidatus Spechtbacterales bacterium]
MKVLFFGDVFGRPGREALKKYAPGLVDKYKPDFVIANIENIAHGSGITQNTVEQMEALNIFDAYTLGDHIWDRRETKELLESSNLNIVRPANLEGPGRGGIVVVKGARRLLVVNLLGYVIRVDKDKKASIKLEAGNPFQEIDKILEEFAISASESTGEQIDGIFVDFHAEFTGEKRAMGFHLDGRVSAIIGTHTHVPTSDGQILPEGTAYMSDVGMVGPFNSVIGLGKEEIVEQFVTEISQKTDVSERSRVEIGAVLIEVTKNGLAENITQIREIVEI